MHGCPLSTVPSSRHEFWLKKLEGNRKRDHDVSEKLGNIGWHVITLWECEFYEQPSRVISRISKAVRLISDSE